MAWGFGKSEKESSTTSNEDTKIHYPQNYPGAHDEAVAGDPTYAQDVVQCPPHTTERKLLARIDLHVIPFLVLLYWLAFLDRYAGALGTIVENGELTYPQSKHLQRQRLWPIR